MRNALDTWSPLIRLRLYPSLTCDAVEAGLQIRWVVSRDRGGAIESTKVVPTQGRNAVIVASKSPFAFDEITDLRGEILGDLGMTRRSLVDTQSEYICTGLYVE